MAEPTLYGGDVYVVHNAADTTGLLFFGSFWVLTWLTFLILILVAQIKVFTKAGRKWWNVFIPFYNIYVLLEIVGRPGWWLILLFVPFVNFIILIIVLNDLSKAFGHGVGFTLGLIFFPIIFWLILGFGSSEYQLEKSTKTTTEVTPQNDAKETEVEKA